MRPTGAVHPADENAPLRELLLAALPPLTPRGEQVVVALIDARRASVSADQFARDTGFANRRAVARVLESEGLPPYRHLAHWILILEWTLAWETARTPLTRHASADDRWARSLRRIVKARTGLTWSEVRTRGALWVAAELADRCTPRPAAVPAAEPPSRRAALPLPPTLKAG